jgi:hypothetical protein
VAVRAYESVVGIVFNVCSCSVRAGVAKVALYSAAADRNLPDDLATIMLGALFGAGVTGIR